MTEIVLNEEQTRTIAEAAAPVTIRGSDGRPLGSLDPRDAAVIAQYLRWKADPKPSIPAATVRAHMQALQAEWDRLGGFDVSYGLAYLDELRAGDA